MSPMSEYNNLSKEELLFRVQELDAELKRKKKYGLYWEDKDEDVVLECKNKYPIVRSVEDRRIRNNEIDPVNVLIEGDNYHALQVLNYTHKGKVDVIYIDPPYNTGNKDFIYNDTFIGDDDGYRHSKWLSFMEKRLQLAKELLKDTGVIFISIDDNEQAQLKLLCDSVFGEKNFINYISWKKRSTGGQVKDGSLITQTEFVLIYAKTKPLLTLNKLSRIKLDNKWRDFRKSGGQWQKRFRPNQFYPFYFNKNTNKLSLEIIDSDDILIYPQDNLGVDGYWSNGMETAKIRLENNEFIVKKSKKDTYKIYQLEISKDDENVGNFLDIPLVQSVNEIKELNLEFDTVKPLSFINFILKISSQKDSLILDFFAGSGTTGHAMLELNKEDGGNRKFILVTNNGDEKSEHKIAEKITYERLKKVMNGYTNKKGEHIQGLGGNLEYLRCELIEKDAHPDNLQLSVIKNSAEMVALKEGVFTKMKEHPAYTILHNITQGTTAAYTSIDDSYMEEFKRDLENISGIKSVYMNKFVDYIDAFTGITNISFQEFPEIK